MKALLSIPAKRNKYFNIFGHDSFRRISMYCLLLLGVGLVLLLLYSPEISGGVLLCPVKRYLGLQCPGCGTLRAMHALLHGDLRAALNYNPLSVALLPVVLLYLSFGALLGREPYHKLQVWAGRALIVVIISFTIIRNL